MQPGILMTGPMMPELEARLEAAGRVHRLHKAPDRAALLAAVAPEVRVIVTGGVVGADAALMGALPKLGLVAVNGIGTDAVDLVHARARGIRVTTTPGVLTEDVADLAMALVLAGLRRLCEGDRYVRAGLWGKQPLGLARKATGRRMGILGLGRIGQAVARRAAGFDMPVAYVDVVDVPGAPGPRMADARALAEWAEVLVVAAAGGEGSRRAVDRTVLDALGPEGLLVNVARGSIVDEAALVAALREGRLGGAALDVFEDEPRVPEALWAMENVVLQPHRASATVETRRAMAALVLSNVEAFLAGRELPTPVA